MLRIHFTGSDLRRITVAPNSDPLWDVLLSLHVLQDRANSVVFDEWRRRTWTAAPVPIRILAELAPPWGYSPDFLTPGRGDAELGVLMDTVMSTPREHLSHDLAELAQVRRPTRWTTRLADGDPKALRQLAAVAAEYHRLALLPYQDSIDALVKADRDRRAQALLAGGVDRLLSSLHPRCIWEAPVLQVPIYADRDLHLAGRGLVLVPSLFCRIQPITLLVNDRPPVLVYPLSPRLGWLRATGRTDDPELSPVGSLLGSTRARILDAATVRGTTSELAGRVGVGMPVVSRHTAALRAAGLLSSQRHGGSVTHSVTALGMAVLNRELPM
jgi:DNA-binding transcriptional ArsR family regulator